MRKISVTVEFETNMTDLEMDEFLDTIEPALFHKDYPRLAYLHRHVEVGDIQEWSCRCHPMLSGTNPDCPRHGFSDKAVEITG